MVFLDGRRKKRTELQLHYMSHAIRESRTATILNIFFFRAWRHSVVWRTSIELPTAPKMDEDRVRRIRLPPSMETMETICLFERIRFVDTY